MPSASSGFIGIAGDFGDQRHVLPRRQAGNQVVELKHEAHVVAAIARQRRVVEFGELLAAVEHRAAGGHVEPAQNIEQRALAAAGGAQQHDELAGVQVEVDAPQRVHVDLAHVVDLGDLPCGENRLGARGGGGAHGVPSTLQWRRRVRAGLASAAGVKATRPVRAWCQVSAGPIAGESNRAVRSQGPTVNDGHYDPAAAYLAQRSGLCRLCWRRHR